MRNRGARSIQDQTLCWTCKKAVGFCSWSKSFTPVKGWNAKKVKYKVAKMDVEYEDSYIVKECPEYERG